VTEPYRLDGRVIIVTGASRGIGATVARQASRLGAALVLVARSPGDLDAVAGDLAGPVATVAGDVGDTDTVAEALDAAETLGPLWGLVNNAGINPFYHPVTETPLAEWDEVLRVNLLGAAAFARGCARVMVEQGTGGRIVNLGSIAGLTGLPNIGPYNASKAALDALTRTLAVELGPAGILVNSVAPGTIATEMVDALFQANPALRERLVAKSPLGRVGTVDEAAWPIVFLLSDAAGFITGHVLLVDGGRLAAG
jgi:NAD(P)-dependent dehydrogenase (short-subunit alcohol dehydrogenase family)